MHRVVSPTQGTRYSVGFFHWGVAADTRIADTKFECEGPRRWVPPPNMAPRPHKIQEVRGRRAAARAAAAAAAAAYTSTPPATTPNITSPPATAPPANAPPIAAAANFISPTATYSYATYYDDDSDIEGQILPF
ncbi:hypothetical protein GGX14DRAFT_402187 [Mycena pura]|uniref:Uncharacterized protein n=1 Tax=Mycena pura TaxID=153505 RepID=A0AAD6V2T8_9AGAR|nr:hypothetical protein GGX14DRAFT_402187 [Mycena pura]